MQSLRSSAVRAFGSVAKGHGAHDIKNPTADVTISLVLGKHSCCTGFERSACLFSVVANVRESLDLAWLLYYSHDRLFFQIFSFNFCLWLFCHQLRMHLLIAVYALSFIASSRHEFVAWLHYLGFGMALAWDVLYASPLKQKYAEHSKGSGNINGQAMKHWCIHPVAMNLQIALVVRDLAAVNEQK
jgi:hypothetical protein